MKPLFTKKSLCVISLVTALLLPSPAFAGVANGEYSLKDITNPGSQWKVSQIAEGMYFHRNKTNPSADGLKMKQTIENQSAVVFQIDEATNLTLCFVSSSTKTEETANVAIYQITEEEYISIQNAAANSTTIQRSTLDLTTQASGSCIFRAGQADLTRYCDYIDVKPGYWYLEAVEENSTGTLTMTSIVINDITCAPSFIVGGNDGWAGGANYNMDDDANLTFTVEVQPSDPSHTLQYTWWYYYDNNPTTATIVEDATNSPSYTPSTSRAHSGYIYYCVVAEIGCGNTIQTKYTGTVTVTNRAIFDYTGNIGSYTSTGATAETNLVTFSYDYISQSSEYNYVEITAKDNMGFCAYDTIVYYDRAKNADQSHLVIYDVNDNLIYESGEEAGTEFTKHTVVLTEEMLPSKVDNLRFARKGKTGYYVSEFRVFAYKDREEQSLNVNIKDNTDSYQVDLSVVAADKTNSFMVDIIEKSLVAGKTNEEIANYILEKHSFEYGDDDIAEYTYKESMSKTFCGNEFTPNNSYVVCAFYFNGDDVDPELLNPELITVKDYIGIETYSQTAKYDITFRENENDFCNDRNTDVTTVDDIIFSGADLVSSISATKIFNAKAGHGIKMGSANYAGELTITLAKSLPSSKITIYAKRWSEDESQIIINGETISLDSEIKGYDIDFSGDNITMANAKKKMRAYVLGIDLDGTEPQPCTTKTNSISAEICAGESYPFGTQTLSTNGTYTETFKTDQGCDSIVTLTLKVNEATFGTITETAIGSYTVNGETFTESGTYTQHLKNISGCDSTLTINLTIEPEIEPCKPKTTTLNETLCEGQGYILGTQTLTETGVYSETFKTVDDCDSVVTVNLTVNKHTTYTMTESAKDEFMFFGTKYTESGTYHHTIPNAAGCDSVITVVLTITHDIPCEPKATTLNESICQGETYKVGTSVFKETGTFTIPLTAQDGCDSIVTLNLTVNKPTSSSLTETAEESYTLNGETYTQSGTYTQHLTNKAGCDSTITLKLTITEKPIPCQPILNTLNETICEGESFNFDGAERTESGTYTATYTNDKGCDSIVTLNLTVNKKTYYTFAHTAVKFYNWFGKTYTQSGQYTAKLENKAGCDSIITLNLTVLDKDTVPECEPIAYSAVSDNAVAGKVNIVQEPACDNQNTLIVSAEANSGYKFTKWSDGSIETLRIITLTEPVNLIAYFEAEEIPCTPFSILVLNSNNEAGTATAIQQPTCENGNQAIVQAVSNDESKYVFDHWDDGSKDATHTITLTKHTVITAYWAKQDQPQPCTTPYQLTINYSDPKGGKATITQQPTCENNNTAVVSVAANDGYMFAGWENGAIDNPRTIVLTENTTITAVFVAQTPVCTPYTLTLKAESSQGSATVSQQPSCDNDNTAVFQAFPTDYYIFSQWSDGNKENPRTLTLTSNLTLTAHFTPKQFTVTATAQDEQQGSISGSGTYTYNATVTLVATPKPGYTFSQWSDGETQNPRTVNVTQDITLQALFSASYHTLTVMPQDAAMGTTTGSGTYQDYTVATITAAANEGYVFKCWNDGDTQATRNILVLEDQTYTAIFTSVIEGGIYIEVLSANDGMGRVTGSGYYAAGQQVTMTATPQPGYEFVRWSDDVTDNPRIITAYYSATYWAYFWFPTGLEDAEIQGLSVYNLELHIDGHEGEMISIYSATGQTIYHGLVQPVIQLPYHGIYLIQLGNNVAKIGC